MDDFVLSHDDIQALIEETEALGWDNPIQLETHDRSSTTREGFVFIGKLLALKPLNTHHVHQTLSSVWSFVAPLSLEDLSSNTFLFTVPHKGYFTRIMNQRPWNIRGSLLLLQPWSPSLAIDEVKILFCPFWVQVHNLRHQYMTIKNAIRIGKGIGKFLELNHFNLGSLICHQFLRFKIDVNTSQPLAPGFYISRHDLDPHWIAFKYERLDEYCVAGGLIGHKKKDYPAPQILDLSEKYIISLKPIASNGPRMVTTVQSEDYDYGISTTATMGIFQCSIESMHAFSSSNKNLTHMVPHAQTKNALLLTREDFSHAHSSSHGISTSTAPNTAHYMAPTQRAKSHISILGQHAPTSQHKWRPSTHVQTIC